MTAQLTHSHLVGGTVVGGNEVGYSFGLREVHLTVEIGTLGELAWKGHPAAILYEQFKYLVNDIARAVTRDLRAVFARVAVRGLENGNQYLVDIGNMSVMDGVRPGVGEVFREDTRKNLKRLIS